MKKGKVVVTILLVIVVGILMFIVGQYASSKMDYNMFKESEKDNKTEEKVTESTKTTEDDTNDKEVLEEITKIYKEVYQEMVDFDNPSKSITKSDFENNTATYSVNQEVASKYFTDKGIAYLESSLSNGESILIGSIFGSTDSGRRPLKIVSESSDTVVATGQIINGVTLDGQSDEIDSDSYPLYIIFKKVDNTYKIDMFE